MSEAAYAARLEFAQLRQADWHGFEHGPAVVYLLAHARCETYYIDIAENSAALRANWKRITDHQTWSLPTSQLKLPLLVWFETAVDPPAAQARLKQVRALPHAWQRKLVEAMNPDWVDLYAYRHRHPLQHMTTVGEREPLYRDLLA